MGYVSLPDNDPPEPATAHHCGGRSDVAGGTGSYFDPVTIATASDELGVCDIVYLTLLLTKYGRYEEGCPR